MSLSIKELATIYYSKAEPNKYDFNIPQSRENARMNLLRVKNIDLDLLRESFEEIISNQRKEFELFLEEKSKYKPQKVGRKKKNK